MYFSKYKAQPRIRSKNPIIKWFKVLKVNDNWIKNTSGDLINSMPSLLNLRVIDISDCLVGNENSLAIFKSFQVIFYFKP